MWQRFTERTRRVIFFAQEEAARMSHNFVGTEHILLGLVREDDSLAARLLVRKLGVSLAAVRAETERRVSPGTDPPGREMQLTPRAKRVIDFAYEEARALNNNYIGSEHLLIGIVREDDGVAGEVLRKLGVTLEQTREAVRQHQNEESPVNDTVEMLTVLTEHGPVNVPLGEVQRVAITRTDGEVVEGRMVHISHQRL